MRRRGTWLVDGVWHHGCGCGWTGPGGSEWQAHQESHGQRPTIRREVPPVVEPTPCPEGCRCPDCGPLLTGMPDAAWKAEL